MKLRLLLAGSASLMVAVACSGATSTELFSAPDSPLGANPTTAPTAGSSGDSNGSSESPASRDRSPDVGPASSSGSPSGTSSSDGGTDASKDATTSSGTIHCGSSPACTAKSEVCCRRSGTGNTSESSCEAAGILSCVGGSPIACDDRLDCPAGQVCCGRLESSGYTSVECKSSCNDGGQQGIRAVRFCDPNAAVDECVAISRHCAESQSMPGYHVCST